MQSRTIILRKKLSLKKREIKKLTTQRLVYTKRARELHKKIMELNSIDCS